MTPTTVIAVTLPSWMTVLTTPEAALACSRGILARTTSASVPETTPNASPAAASEGASCHPVRALPAAWMTAIMLRMASVMRTAPAVIAYRPYFWPSGAAPPEPTTMPREKGRKASPVRSGE